MPPIIFTLVESSSLFAQNFQPLTDRNKLRFAEEHSDFQLIFEELYPEFFDIKLTAMKLAKRYIELETNSGKNSLREMNELNDQVNLLNERLNILLGIMIVN